MTVTCLVQARTGSTRFPGKVLAEVGGRPMLAFMLDRLRGAGIDHLAVATSDRPGDDRIAELAEDSGIAVVRGSEQDVLGRLLVGLDRFPADHVVRLTADCPLIDAALLDDVVRTHIEAGADYTSNTLLRTYPDGLDVEVIRSDALRAAGTEAIDPPEREHVTPFVYRRPERFRLAAHLTKESLGAERWTVDTPEDLDFVRATLERVGDPAAPWPAILAVIGRHHVPPPVHLEPARPADPGARRWTVLAAGEAVGWLAVTVRTGVGRLDGDVAVEHRAPALQQLQQTLRQDFQVQVLHAGRSWGDDVLAATGFEAGANDATWAR